MCILPVIIILVSGFNPWKIWKSIGMMTFPIYETIKILWNANQKVIGFDQSPIPSNKELIISPRPFLKGSLHRHGFFERKRLRTWHVWLFAMGTPVICPKLWLKVLNLLWMEEILHQLIDGLSMFSPLFLGFQQLLKVMQDFATIHSI